MKKEELITILENKKKNKFTSSIIQFLIDSEFFFISEEDVNFLYYLIPKINDHYFFEQINKLIIEFEKNAFQIHLSNENEIKGFLKKKKIKIDLKVQFKFFIFLKKNLNSFVREQVAITPYKNHISKTYNGHSLLDFVTNIVLIDKKIGVQKFEQLIEKVNKKSEENIILLSYLSNFILIEFNKIIVNFFDLVKEEEMIEKNGKKIPKKQYFISFYNHFLKLFPKEKIEHMFKTLGYKDSNLIYFQQSLKNLNISGQTTSHFVQAAYLKRIVGEYAILNNQKINILNTDKENPYARIYFYGNSLEENSLEEKLWEIENKINDYLNYVEYNIYDGSDKKAFFNPIIGFYAEIKFMLWFFYIRTPDFLDDLEDGYLSFLKNDKTIINENNIQNYFQNISKEKRLILFKEIQYCMLYYLIDFFNNKINNPSINNYLKDYLIKNKKEQLGKFFLSPHNYSFYRNVIIKLDNFFNSNQKNYPKYLGCIKNIDLLEFGSSFAIFRNLDNKVNIFSTDEPIDLVYFPINKNKIFILFNETKKNILMQEIECFDKYCMTNYKKQNFIVKTI